ncbi:hypothetical protein HDU99_004092 [Rhizoclosmatium hyalinum]|nr:hypothetical protein HDU99_004092 [Rhizoclosmatium hyalinum]
MDLVRMDLNSESNTHINDQPQSSSPDARVGLVTGFVRTIAVQGSMMVMGFTKGLLKWWFRLPVKLFRPYAVNPYLVLSHMAEQDGKTLSTSYMRGVVKNEGWGVISRNIAPLLLVNSLIGAFLFNTYTFSSHFLESKFKQDPSSKQKQLSFDWIPFVSGGIAGASQSLLSTPVDNMQRSLSTDAILAHRHARGGIASLIFANLKGLAATAASPLTDLVSPHHEPNSTTPGTHTTRQPYLHQRLLTRLAPYKPLYQNFSLTCTRDSIGFALFFGLFENGRDFGKAAVQRIQDELYANNVDYHVNANPILKGVTITGPQALAVVGAGGLAGMGFQAVSYPIERVNAERLGREGHVKESWVHTFNRMGGFRQVYKGIGGQLVRVVPASAVGLFVFEIVNEYLGP